MRRPKKAGLPQHEVAKRLKRPQTFVPKYDERRIDIVEFLTIGRAIDADPVRLLRALTRQMD